VCACNLFDVSFAFAFVAGGGLCALEVFGASAFGVDPFTSLLPLTGAALLLDRLVLNGALFEAATRLVAPQYREKVIRRRVVMMER
jgi:hypothetical protein